MEVRDCPVQIISLANCTSAMIADRVVLLPGCHVGRRTVMGSGALGKRDTVYEDGSTWMGCGTRNPPKHHIIYSPFGQIMVNLSVSEEARRSLMKRTSKAVHLVVHFMRAKRIIGYSHIGSSSPPTSQSRPSLLLIGQSAPSLLPCSSVISI